jgi:hypothetical protein
MKDSAILTIALAALLPGIPACGDDDNPGDASTNFSATMSGTAEVPAVPSTATGTATFSLSGSQLTYTVNVNGLANPVFSHIHIAPVGENGPVRLNLCGTGAPVPECGTGDGVLVTGTNGTTVGSPAITFDSLVSAMRAGNTYSGEIRGQITGE